MSDPGLFKYIEANIRGFIEEFEGHFSLVSYHTGEFLNHLKKVGKIQNYTLKHKLLGGVEFIDIRYLHESTDAGMPHLTIPMHHAVIERLFKDTELPWWDGGKE